MKLSKEQELAVNSEENLIFVRAAAGTGKTAVLVERARRILDIPKTKVVIFTFTVEAAKELSNRLDILPFFIGTIHSFALQEIKKLSKEFLFTPKIMEEEKVKRLLQKCVISKKGVSQYLAMEVNNIYNFYFNKDIQYDLQTRNFFYSIINLYNIEKRKLGLYDIMDTPEYLLVLMKRFNKKFNYTHLFVDEVQDIDENEFQLIQAFKCKIFVIGDPRQQIYQFRGSVPNVLDKFIDLNYAEYALSLNFRNYQEILNYAEANKLIAERGYGGRVVGKGFLKERQPFTLLTRYNKEVIRLQESYPEVRTIHSAKGLEFDNVLIVDFQLKTEEDENIMYVAKTRAKNVVGVLTLKEFIEMEKIYGFKPI